VGEIHAGRRAARNLLKGAVMTFSPDRKTVDFTCGGDCGETDPMPMLLLKQD
jgi:hypothetical protein